MKSPLRILIAAAALTVSACSAEKKDVDTSGAAGVRVPDTTSTRSAPTPPAVADKSMGSWKVSESGIGPVRAGMTAREAVATLQGAGVGATADSSTTCHYLKWSGPADVRVMLEGGVVARVEVGNHDITTNEGAKIGDTEAQIQSLYPGRVTVQPHKYTKGHYLVVKPAAASDSALRIIFETDGTRVTTYRAGKEPQVSYVESCS